MLANGWISRPNVTIRLLGTKNDYQRDGQRVFLRPATDKIMCPVLAFQQYQETVKHCDTQGSRPVFLTLTQPVRALSASGVAAVLNEALNLSGQGQFSAKSFCPTGATLAVEAGVHPDTVRALGRWKNRECFEFHSVHSRPAKTVTDSILLSHS